MGKKKSVVLMVILTIVIVVLCAITAFPAFAVPGTVKKWNPAIMQYDLGADLGGGYYAYYYPEGVITETEYDNELSALNAAIEAAADADEKAEAEEAKAEYVDSYLSHKGLYLSKDEDKNLVAANGTDVMDSFKESFSAAAKEISARYAAQGYSDYRVAIVDDYSIRVELPLSEANAGNVLSMFLHTGEMTIEMGGETVDELKSTDAAITDLIKSFSVGDQYGVSYVRLNLTSAGKDMIVAAKETLTTSDSKDTATTLDVKIGDTTILSVYQDHIDTKNTVKVPLAYVENRAYVDTVCNLLNSVLNNGGFDVEFRDLATSEVRVFEPVYGENTLLLIYIAIAVVIVALIVGAIVKMGGFGGMNAYTTLSYLIVTGLCFAFISGGVFEVTLGTVLIFLAGLVLTNVLNGYIYKAIKAEFDLGKTVESSVRGGYNKTLWNVVDVYAVLVLGCIALLIGVAGAYTLALQGLICVITAAFCNLLWGRFINFVNLSASKNKYKYFRFVREDDDDE